MSLRGRGWVSHLRRFRLDALAFAVASLAIAPRVRAEASELDPTVGYNYGEIETARSIATGGAKRALSSSTTALFTNPANIAVERMYHLGAFAQIWPEARRQSYGAASADSASSGSRFAGGLGATYNFQDTDGIDRRWTDIRFALAYPFADTFYVGLGGRYMWLTQNGQGPLGVSLASSGLPGEQIVRAFTFDAGVTLKPSPDFALSVVGTNLTNPSNGFMPTTVGGGLGFGRKQFAAEIDVVADFDSWKETTMRSMAGLEFLLGTNVGLRGGYRYDQGAESHAIALGAAYIDRSFILDVGARRTVAGATATAIVIGFTYHLETTGLTPSPGDTF
jgi:opacity protein-like surface antigen